MPIIFEWTHSILRQTFDTFLHLQVGRYATYTALAMFHRLIERSLQNCSLCDNWISETISRVSELFVRTKRARGSTRMCCTAN